MTFVCVILSGPRPQKRPQDAQPHDEIMCSWGLGALPSTSKNGDCRVSGNLHLGTRGYREALLATFHNVLT